MRLPKKARKWPAKLREQVLEVLDEGGRLEQGGGDHYALFSASGRRLTTIALSPSDRRSLLNTASDLRRAKAQ